MDESDFSDANSLDDTVLSSDEDIASTKYGTFLEKLADDMQYLSEDSDDNYDFESDAMDESADVSDIETTLGETLNDSCDLFALAAETGDGPSQITRRPNAVLFRKLKTLSHNRKNARYQGGFTSVMSGLPPLIGVPENFGWSDVIVRAIRKPDFTPKDLPGVIGISESDDVLDIYLRQVKDAFELFSKFSNQKREEMTQNGSEKYSALDEKDMYAFQSANLWMDTKKLPTVNEYFSKDKLLGDPFIINLRDISGMSRNHFNGIFKTARLYDKEQCKLDKRSDKNSDNYDPQFKCREVLKAFTFSAQKCMNPDRHLSVDESMDLYTVIKKYKSSLLN